MPDLNPAKLKRRRRAAARTLLSDSRGVSVARKKHLVDGALLDTLPFNACDAWQAQQAFLADQKEADRLEIEAWEAASSPGGTDEEVLLARHRGEMYGKSLPFAQRRFDSRSGACHAPRSGCGALGRPDTHPSI